jgi:L-ribulokinase
MAIVAGVDYGTLSVRVSIVCSERGRIGSGVAEYPLHRKREDPDHATQSHADHMSALVAAMGKALAAAGVHGSAIEARWPLTRPARALCRWTKTFSLWTITISGAITARGAKPPRSPPKRTKRASKRFNGAAATYSSEWGFSKLLHWLRNNPDKRGRIGQRPGALRHGCRHALRHHDGRGRAAQSICAMGHKWMWNASLGGLPPEEFLVAVDPLLAGVRAKLQGRYETSDEDRRAPLVGMGRETRPCGKASRFRWARSTPIGTPSARASQGGRRGQRGRHLDLHHGHHAKACRLVPGVCGVVAGSIHPSTDRHRGRTVGLQAISSSRHRQTRRRHSVRRFRKGSKDSAPARPACFA